MIGVVVTAIAPSFSAAVVGGYIGLGFAAVSGGSLIYGIGNAT